MTRFLMVSCAVAACLAAANFGCGTKDAKVLDVSFTYAGGDPFADPDVADFIFMIADGFPSVEFGAYIYGPDCGLGLAPLCGYPKGTEKFDLRLYFEDCRPQGCTGYMPPEVEAQIRFCARNAAGDTIYKGSGTFFNDPAQAETQTVVINVGLEGITACP